MVGSLNLDLVVRAPRAPQAGETVVGSGFSRYPGGKGANQACAAARLAGDRAGVSLIARVGDDAEGQWLRQALAGSAAGLDLSAVGVDPALPTGVAAITVDGAGQNRIVVVPGANQGLTPGALGRHHHQLAAADVLLLQLEIPLPTVQTAARMGREKRARVILDPAPARPLPDSLLALCDFVTPNESELRVLDGRAPAASGSDPAGGTSPEPEEAEVVAAARRLLARGARRVIVKRGARGALLVTPAGEQVWPAWPVSAVDTTAAGDAWNAAFALALALGQPLDGAGALANAAGALTVTRPGAQPSLPTREELERFLSERASP